MTAFIIEVALIQPKHGYVFVVTMVAFWLLTLMPTAYVTKTRSSLPAVVGATLGFGLPQLLFRAWILMVDLARRP